MLEGCGGAFTQNPLSLERLKGMGGFPDAFAAGQTDGVALEREGGFPECFGADALKGEWVSHNPLPVAILLQMLLVTSQIDGDPGREDNLGVLPRIPCGWPCV